MAAKIVSRPQTAGDSGRLSSSPTVGCVICGATNKLLRCSRCKTVVYCNKEHQRLDWKRHKEFCAASSVNTSANADSSLVAGLAAGSRRQIRVGRENSTNGSGAGVLASLNGNIVGELNRIQKPVDVAEKIEERVCGT